MLEVLRGESIPIKKLHFVLEKVLQIIKTKKKKGSLRNALNGYFGNQKWFTTVKKKQPESVPQNNHVFHHHGKHANFGSFQKLMHLC